MKKLLLVFLLIPLVFFGQNIPVKKINEAMEYWVYHFSGNPIDGKERHAFRINNEYDNEGVFLLKIINSAESIKIENSTIGEGDNRDDILIDIRSSISVKNLDEILMYFDNEDKFYNINFRTYGDKGIFWWNAVQNNKNGFMSRFNFIHKLKTKNTVFFRFKYFDRNDLNVSFSLNRSTSTINRVVDLSNINLNEDDFHMDMINGVIKIKNILESPSFQKDFIYLNIKSLKEFSSTLIDYLDEKIGKYALAYTNYNYKGNFLLEVLNYNDKELMTIDLNQFKKEPKTPIQALYFDLIQQKYYTNSFEEFTVKISNRDYQDKVYNVLVRDGKYNKARTEFYSEYSSPEDKKIEFLFNYLKENRIFSDKTLLPKFKEANSEQKRELYDLAMKEGVFKSLKFQEFLSNWDDVFNETQNIKKNEIYLTNKFWVATIDNFITDTPSLKGNKKIFEVKEGGLVQLYSTIITNEYYQYISFYNMNNDKVYKGYVHKAFYKPRE